MGRRVGGGRQRLTPAQRREEILAAASRVFMKTDPTAVTFEDIAAEAGVSRALVYNYFGDRGALLAAVYTHTIDELDEQLMAALCADLPLEARLQALVWHYVTFAQAHRGTWHLLGHVATTRHPIVAAARLDRVARFASVIEDSALMRLTMAALLGMLEEALAHWLVETEVPVADLVARLEELVITGIAPLWQPRVSELAS